MKYKGRIVTTLISIIVGIPYVAYNYITLQSSIRTFIDTTVLIVTTVTLWWLGKQYDKAKFYSEKDYLTGLYNRRFIEEIFPKLISSAKKIEQLSILILDCNDFKQINDTDGHKYGDLVLENISTILLKSTSVSDIIARWGGDEFLIISPFSDQTETEAMIKRIENGLRELSQKTEKKISVSAGFAIYPIDGKDMDSLIKIADKNMYKLKTLSKKATLKKI
ncbi:GGDEF domain-containing protein [Neobacillus sp. C211]|uniref:GGDEF domain-containing protein n=1 Tax=unclassified Neobacillus TaxID=2675272 RepID=UPI003979041A